MLSMDGLTKRKMNRDGGKQVTTNFFFKAFAMYQIML